MANEHNLIDGSTNRIDFVLGTGIRVKACPNGTIQLTDNAGNGIQIASGGAVTVIGGGSFPSAPVTSVFGRTGAVLAQSGDYLVNQVTGAAPVASPSFTGTVTLPTNETIPAAGILISPASGTSVVEAVPFGDSLEISDGGVAGHANQDSILLGPASAAGATGGISLTGCLGSSIQIDPGGTGGPTGAEYIQIGTTGNSGEEILLTTNNGSGPQLEITHTQAVLSSASVTGQTRVLLQTNGILLTGNVTQYGSTQTSLVNGGIPVEVGTADLTAQAAAKSATTLFTPPAGGPAAVRVRISAYLKVTTPATTSSILGGVTITFTDGTDSVAQSIVMQMQSKAGLSETSDTGNTTTTTLCGEVFIWAKANVAIQYAIAYTSVGGTAMAYEAHLVAENMQ